MAAGLPTLAMIANRRRFDLAQKFESLTNKISVLDRESGDVPARVSQTRDETGANRVRCRREDYRDERCCPLCREHYWGCICDNDIDFKSDELGSALGRTSAHA